MISKEDYIRLKRDIRCMCYSSIEELCNNAKLNEEEKELLLHFYNKDTRTEVCLKMCISVKYYTSHMKMLFSKIKDYLKTYSNN